MVNIISTETEMCYLRYFRQMDRMANEVLKEVIQGMHVKTAAINPDSVLDVLFEKKIIVPDDYERLRPFPVTRDRCRGMLSLLHQSPHPQAFIYLRLALIDDYPWLVDEIDQQIDLPSLTSRLQQLALDHSTDGKLLLWAYNYLCDKKQLIWFSLVVCVSE